MHLNIVHGGSTLPIMIPAALKRPGIGAIEPASAAMFLILRGIASLQESLSVFGSPDWLFECMAVAAEDLPHNSRIGMSGPIEKLDQPDPAAKSLAIDDDHFSSNNVFIQWRDAQRWANNTVMTAPAFGLGCTMPWQFRMDFAVMSLAAHLAVQASKNGLMWFHEACALTRDILSLERPDPDHFFDRITPESAMAAGFCWLDPFARQPVVYNLYSLRASSAEFYLTMTHYADYLGRLTLDDLKAIRSLLSELYADGADYSSALSAHQSLALASHAIQLAGGIRAILEVLDFAPAVSAYDGAADTAATDPLSIGRI